MEFDFDAFTLLATDPFAAARYAHDPAAWLATAGIDREQLRRAPEEFVRCECCCDPGPDPYPELAVRECGGASG